MPTVITEAEQIEKLNAELIERNRDLLVLTERNNELASFQKEAVDSRTSIATLSEKVTELNDAVSKANARVSAAEATVKSAAANAASDASTVEAARALAAAIKTLS